MAKEHARRDPLFCCCCTTTTTTATTTTSEEKEEDVTAATPAAAAAAHRKKLRYLCGTVDELGRGCGSGGGYQGEEEKDDDEEEKEEEGGDMYDVVTAMEVLEHVRSPEQFLAQCAARVRPGGWLAISTIARHPVSWVTTKLLAEGVLRVVPWGTHDWSRYVNVEELREWVGRWSVGGGAGGAGGAGREAGWEVVDTVVMGCVYVPGLGWKEVPGAERVGNYFFAVRRAPGRPA